MEGQEQYRIVKQLMSLYCYNKYEHRYMYIDANNNVQYKDPHQEITFPDLYDHLDGNRAISVYGRKYTTKFMTFDVDENSPEKVKLLINRMADDGIPRERIYVSTSGNKGYHIDVFFDDGVLKSLVENYYHDIRRDPIIKEINFEVFPIRHETIKIPLGVNLKTGRRCWYVDRETLEPYEGDYDYIMSIQPILSREFVSMVYALNKKAKAEDIEIAKTRKFEKKKTQRKKFSTKGEPVITEPGQRHQLMCKRAVYLRCIGGDEETIFNELIAWVGRQDPNLIGSSDREIERDAASIARDVVKKYEVAVKDTNPKPTQGGGSYINGSDIQLALCAPTRQSRMVAFLLCLYCRKFGTCKMGYDRIAEKVGMSPRGVFKAIEKLIAAGIVEKVSQGKLVQYDGGPMLMPNEYKVVYPGVQDNTIKVKFNLNKLDDFPGFYYQTLVETCGIKMLKKYLTANEIKICKAVSAE